MFHLLLLCCFRNRKQISEPASTQMIKQNKQITKTIIIIIQATINKTKIKKHSENTQNHKIKQASAQSIRQTKQKTADVVGGARSPFSRLPLVCVCAYIVRFLLLCSVCLGLQLVTRLCAVF